MAISNEVSINLLDDNTDQSSITVNGIEFIPLVWNGKEVGEEITPLEQIKIHQTIDFICDAVVHYLQTAQKKEYK